MSYRVVANPIPSGSHGLRRSAEGLQMKCDWYFERVPFNQDAVLDVERTPGTVDMIFLVWRLVISRRSA